MIVGLGGLNTVVSPTEKANTHHHANILYSSSLGEAFVGSLLVSRTNSFHCNRHHAETASNFFGRDNDILSFLTCSKASSIFSK